jgi:hypothetical protein
MKSNIINEITNAEKRPPKFRLAELQDLANLVACC